MFYSLNPLLSLQKWLNNISSDLIQYVVAISIIENLAQTPFQLNWIFFCVWFEKPLQIRSHYHRNIFCISRQLVARPQKSCHPWESIEHRIENNPFILGLQRKSFGENIIKEIWLERKNLLPEELCNFSKKILFWSTRVAL